MTTWKHLSNSIDEEPEPSQTRTIRLRSTEHEPNLLKVCRTRTEPNPRFWVLWHL